MNEDNLRSRRRSARVMISIPIFIWGRDAGGNAYGERVHTQVVNQHGGLVATTRPLARGTEVMVENPATGVWANAGVVWSREKDDARDLHSMGLELLSAQNFWGMTFPPDDWHPKSGEETPPAPNSP